MLKFVLMKRLFILTVALLYLGTAMGVGLNFHYCFGQLASVKLYQNTPSCKFIRKTRLPDCCKSKHIALKVKDSHQPSQYTFAAKNMVVALPAQAFANFQFYLPQLILKKQGSRSPPEAPVFNLPVFLKNCTFRI